MFLGVNMLNFFIIIRKETPEVVILDCGVLVVRSRFWRNRECNYLSIVFMNWICFFVRLHSTFRASP